MKTIHKNARKKLRGGTALKALALIGATASASTIFAAPAAAQDYQNVVASGRVTDSSGAAIRGATITVTSEEQGFTRTATTGGDGAYRITALPPGAYTFEIVADGFATYRESGVSLTQSQSGNTFQLAPASAAADEVADDGAIVVIGRRVEVADFENTTTGAVINVSDVANRVPVARDLTSVIQLSPGTGQGDSAFGNLPNIAGASVAENVYYINGLNITNFRTFLGSNSVPFEFYETVEIKNGGYPAEFGRGTGGVVNATTKSGTNEYHAGVVTTWEPDSLRSRQPNTRTADNDFDYSEELRSTFYLSGPILKDRLFFYGLYETRNVQSGSGSLTSEQYTRSKTDSPFFAAKVDAIITDGHRLEGTYFRTTGTSRVVTNNYDPATNELGGFAGEYLSEYGGDNYVGRYTGTFTDWLTISAAYGKSENRDNTTSSQPDLPLVLDYRFDDAGESLAQPTSSYFIESHVDEREFYRADADVYFNLLGSHHVRFGYDRENLFTEGGTGYTSGSYYQIYAGEGGNPDFVAQRTFINGGGFESQNEAFYIQDNWSLLNDRLTLQLGVRNDRFENRNIEGVPFYSSGDQWGPRLGFAADVFGDGRTKFYGNYGRYFLPIAANTNIRMAGSEYDVREYWVLEGINSDGTPILGAPINDYNACINTSNMNCTVNADGAVIPTTNTIAQNLKPQSLDEYILGVEHRFGERIKVGLYGTYRTLNRALEDVAVDQAALAYCAANGIAMETAEGDGCAQVYTGFHQYVLVNPGEDARVTLFPLAGQDAQTVDLTAEQLGYPKAERTYKAITLTFDREFDGVWGLSGSYTWSKTEGNYEGAVKSDVGQDDAGATQDFDQPGLVPGSYGYLPQDHRHNFKLYGSYQVTPWLLFGGNLQTISPRHYGCIGVVPRTLNGDVVGEDPFAWRYGAAGNYCRFADGEVSQDNPVVLVPRGTGFKSDWSTSLDISAAVTIPNDYVEAVFRVDVFNVFNSQAAIDFDEFGSLDELQTIREDPTDPDSPVLEYRQIASDTYGNILTYQAPRSVRLQMQLRF